MSGSYTYACVHTAQNICGEFHGVSEGQKFSDDIRETCQHEIQIWQQEILVQGLLRRHRGTRRDEAHPGISRVALWASVPPSKTLTMMVEGEFALVPVTAMAM